MVMMTSKKRDLIDRDELIDSLGISDVDIYAKECIREAPTVDAVEVVHGRWELRGNDDNCGCSYFCSNCHDSFDEDWFYMYGQYRHWNYCPHCGATMDLEEGNNE